MRRILFSSKYRREILLVKPCKTICMQVNFPSKDQLGTVKKVVDSAEIKLRGRSILTDYGSVVQGTKVAAETGLKTWDTIVTVAKSGNAATEIALGADALGESIAEWRKGHYFCCVCSGIACSCFWVGACAGLIPGGYGVWQAATQAGSVTKGVTYTCRKITGGF